MKPRLWILMLLFPSWAQAQIDSTELYSSPLEEAVEDIILNSGIDEQIDYSDYLEPLEALAANPLDLNKATLDDLLQLPGMTAIQANRLLYHRTTFGNLTSIYELQAIEGYSLQLIRQMLPYVSVKKVGARDIEASQRFPKGPGLQDILAGLEGEWMQRMTWIVENQTGYTDPDTILKDILGPDGNLLGTDTSLTTRYQGNPYRHYTRVRLRMGNHLSIGLVGEKDPGELFRWKPQQQQYGYDFLSAHISLQHFGRIKRLIVGDYTLQMGQGLVLSRGLGFGKGAQVISGLKMPAYGARPYNSVNENQFLRGAMTTIGLGDFDLSLFASRTRRDASVQQTDTLDQEILMVGTLQTSGLHRTVSEQANRRVIGERVAGVRLAYRKGVFRSGMTHYQLRYDAPLSPSNAFYQTFAFRGDRHHLTGLDWDWVKGNINLFGEAAVDASGAFGGTASLMSSLSATIDASVNIRHFDTDFFSPFAYVFAERAASVQNETGMYLGLRYAPDYHWEFQTYFDQYIFPWHRFRVSYPSQGFEWMAQLTYRFNRATRVYLRVRTEQTERNPNAEVQQILGSPVPIQRDQIRVHFQTNINRVIGLRTRLEGSRFTEQGQADAYGWLMYQDLSWRHGFRWKLTGRFAVFNVDTYDARIYAYENDILGFFSIPAYVNRGTRWYLILNGKLGRGWEFWARVAQTNLADACGLVPLRPDVQGGLAGTDFTEVCTTGSGLEQINSASRTEVKLQLRWKF